MFILLVLSEYPEFFHTLEQENQSRITLNDLKALRFWVDKRKRRSVEPGYKLSKNGRSGSFSVFEENREEIKLLKAFRSNFKDEHIQRKIIEDLKKVNEEIEFEEDNTLNAVLK